MSFSLPAALPAEQKTSVSATPAVQPIEVAARVPVVVPRDSDPRDVCFSTWDERQVNVDEGLAKLRREHLMKYVKATMVGSGLILFVAMIRLSIGAIAPEEAPARTTAARIRDVPVDVATQSVETTTLSARTQTAIKWEHRRETGKQSVTARSKSFW